MFNILLLCQYLYSTLYIYYIYINGLHQPRALDMFNECQDPPKKSLSPRGHGYKSPEKMCKIHPMTGWWFGT